MASIDLSNRVIIDSELLREIARHCESTYPEECCGILLGRLSEEGRIVDQLLPIENRWDDGGRGDRFLIRPQDILAAERAARRQGLDVLGFYHSHPDSPARPSEFDREHAWPWYSYLIASVESGRFVTLAGWQLLDDRAGYDAIPIRTDESVKPDDTAAEIGSLARTTSRL